MAMEIHLHLGVNLQNQTGYKYLGSIRTPHLISQGSSSLSFKAHGEKLRFSTYSGNLGFQSSPVLRLSQSWRCSTINAKGKASGKVYDEQTLLLKEKANEVVSDLDGSCVYLVGMMGSGKSTVGKLLADALDYNFIDSDKVIEEDAGGISVAQLFKQKTEESFRDAETEVLKKLSSKRRMVFATGGGIVVRQVNWNYLKHGITVWLDVPIEALAHRVVAVGMHSRPLLGESNGDSAYTQALARLSSIFEQRAPCYAKSDAIVSLEKIVMQAGFTSVNEITPAMIAAQVLEELKELFQRKKQQQVQHLQLDHPGSLS